MRMIRSLLLLITALAIPLLAQPKISRIEQIPVDKGNRWTQPQFSPDGRSVFYTSSDFAGVWQYSLTNRISTRLTADPGSGMAFAVSPDGRKLVYRRTTFPAGSRMRVQEVVIRDLVAKSSNVLASGRSLSAPSFADGQAVYADGEKTKNLSLRKTASNVTILGIEQTRIALNRNGKKVILDPLGLGRYIWPVLSPDKSKIAAYQMEQGTFVCDLDGKVLTRLGKRNAPAWTRDGKWIVYMNDRDDGHVILSSDLWIISPDDGKVIQLTNTPEIGEMYPQCSPVENQIVCSSLDGKLYLVTYTEGQQ